MDNFYLLQYLYCSIPLQSYHLLLTRSTNLVDNKGIYAKCVECGSTPEKVYIDSDGIQVSYESKLLNDIKDAFKLLDNIKDKETYILLQSDLPDIFNER